MTLKRPQVKGQRKELRDRPATFPGTEFRVEPLQRL
jgi:hypothetical protein